MPDRSISKSKCPTLAMTLVTIASPVARLGGRTFSAFCQSGNLQPGMSDHGWADRSLYRAGAPSMYRRSARRRAGQRGPDLLSVREILPLDAQPLGPSPLGELSAPRFRQAGGAGDDRGMAAFLVALAQECRRAGAQDVRSIWNVMKLAPHSIASGNHAVNFRDPYLTRALLGDWRQVQQKNGSSGRTRTYNPSVNSPALRRCAHVFSVT